MGKKKHPPGDVMACITKVKGSLGFTKETSTPRTYTTVSKRPIFIVTDELIEKVEMKVEFGCSESGSRQVNNIVGYFRYLKIFATFVAFRIIFHIWYTNIEKKIFFLSISNVYSFFQKCCCFLCPFDVEFIKIMKSC